MVRLLPNSRAAGSRGVPARDADDPSGVTMFVSAAAGSGGGEGISLDVTRAPTGYAFSDNDRKAINASAGADQLTKWAVSLTPIPADGTVRYWEVQVAGGNAQYNGYMGIVPESRRNDGSGAGTAAPVIGNGMGYRGNGQLWTDNTIAQAVGSTWGAGALLRFTFNPATGGFGYAKDGGGWNHASANVDTYYLFVQGRDLNEGGTLLSTAEQFVYSVPSGAIPMGA